MVRLAPQVKSCPRKVNEILTAGVRFADERDRVTLAGVGFLYPVPLATLSLLGGRIRRLCPRARQPAARAHKPAGQHPFPWVWPCLFLEAQSRLWGLGAEGRNGAVSSAVLVHHTRGIGPLRLALAGATRSGSAGVGSLGRDPMMRLCRNEPESIGINT